MASKLTGVSWAHSQAPYHLYEFDADNLQRLVETTGFSVERTEMQGSGSFPYLVGATGEFDELKSELKNSGGYRLTRGVLRELPKLALVTTGLFPMWLYGRATDGLRGSGRIMTMVLRRQSGKSS